MQVGGKRQRLCLLSYLLGQLAYHFFDEQEFYSQEQTELKRGYKSLILNDKLIVNVDALEVVNLLSNTKATNRLTQPIVDACRTILQAFQEV